MQSQTMHEMRKFLLSLALLLVCTTIVSTLSGCEGEKKNSDSLDTAVINSTPLKSQQGAGLEEITVSGEVTDGSANAVFIETEDGQTKEFNYDSDNYDSDDLYDWDLDENNKIKVTYVKIQRGDVVMDSVIRIEKAE